MTYGYPTVFCGYEGAREACRRVFAPASRSSFSGSFPAAELSHLPGEPAGVVQAGVNI